MTLEVQAFAKLNLTLDVLGVREDGYHALRMVMQSVSLADTLTLAPEDDGGLRVRSNRDYLPTGEGNLAAKAALRFWEALGQPARGMEITIHKRIPVCAGLGGGSSDAAAVLRALNERHGNPFSPAELSEIGARVGSDVPYCVVGGTALAEGRGEVLTPLAPLPACHIVLCKPPFPVSTPELFARIDNVRISRRPDTAGVMAALERGDLAGVCRRLYNVFEDALPERLGGRVAEIKRHIIQSGALGAVMSGSGPTVFGIFSDAGAAESCCKSLQSEYRETFLAQPV